MIEPVAEKDSWLLAELEQCLGEGERLMREVRERLSGFATEQDGR